MTPPSKSLQEQLEKLKPQLSPIGIQVEQDPLMSSPAASSSGTQTQNSGEIVSESPMATVSIGATRASVPLSGPERDQMVKNILVLQEQTIKRERQAFWSNIGHMALTALAIIGLGTAMYKGVKSEVTDHDPRGKRGYFP